MKFSKQSFEPFENEKIKKVIKKFLIKSQWMLVGSKAKLSNHLLGASLPKGDIFISKIS
jgi:hypothetical protein